MRVLIGSTVSLGALGFMSGNELFFVGAYAAGFLALVKVGADFLQSQSLRGER